MADTDVIDIIAAIDIAAVTDIIATVIDIIAVTAETTSFTVISRYSKCCYFLILNYLNFFFKLLVQMVPSISLLIVSLI